MTSTADIADGSDHLHALAKSATTIIRRVRDGIQMAQRGGDVVTADILAAVQRSAEKYLWLMEAHLPTQRIDHR